MSDASGLMIPDLESDDPAILAALYSGFSVAEHWRKVVLANCREMIRASMVAAGEKVTETRLEDLSRVHPAHLDFMARLLKGRIAWEREVIAQGRLP